MTGFEHGPAVTPVRALPQVYIIMACGHPRIVVANVPEHIALWCGECDGLRHQAPKPYTPQQEYELRAALYHAAKHRRDVIKAALTEAENDLDDAAMAMTELETRPGIPAYTQNGARP